MRSSGVLKARALDQHGSFLPPSWSLSALYLFFFCSLPLPSLPHSLFLTLYLFLLTSKPPIRKYALHQISICHSSFIGHFKRCQLYQIQPSKIQAPSFPPHRRTGLQILKCRSRGLSTTRKLCRHRRGASLQLGSYLEEAQTRGFRSRREI